MRFPDVGDKPSEGDDRPRRSPRRARSRHRPCSRSGRPDLDAPVPAGLFGDAGDVTDNQRSRLQVVAGIVERERPTVRRLLHRLAGARGHRVVAGTPDQVADTMAEWFATGAADGFNVMPPSYLGGLEVFVETVVPILRDRGLFRREYSGHTLREHLGLARPDSPWAEARSRSVSA